MNAIAPLSPVEVPAWPSAPFALINAAQTTPAYWEDLHPLPVVPESFRDQATLFPVLIDMHEDDDKRALVREREQAWEQDADTPYLMALIDASVTASALTSHLIRRMNVRCPDEHEDVLRFYDPYVFRVLRWLLTSEQMDSLLGPTETWYWREPDGTWHSHKRHSATPSLRPLRLTPAQWPSLFRIAEIQQVVQALSRIDPDTAYRAETTQQIDALLAQAQERHRLSDPQDRRLYVLQAVRFHRAIHQHPLLRHRLNQTLHEAMSYVTACSDLDDEFMHKLVHELAQTHTR